MDKAESLYDELFCKISSWRSKYEPPNCNSYFYCLEYTEDGKTMDVDIDFRDATIHLNIDIIKGWNPPDDGLLLSNMEKGAIVRNMYEYLVNVRGFKNVKLEI
jgi:hypothetical protein